MKKPRFPAAFTALVLLLTATLPGAASAAGQKTVKAATAQAVLDALGSNTKIVLSDGTYDFSKTDAGMFYLSDYENLTLSGTGKTKLVTSSGADDVVYATQCSDLTVENCILGHELLPGSYCTVGVMEFLNCKNVTVRNCELYGCGLAGFDFVCCTGDNEVESTTVRDCSQYIVACQCAAANFRGCSFLRNGYKQRADLPDEAVVLKDGAADFEACTFKDNKCPAFSTIPSDFLVGNILGNGNSYSGNAWGDGEPDEMFTHLYLDADPQDWFFLPVSCASARGFMQGTGDDAFSPQGSLTIAQAIKMASLVCSNYYGDEPQISESSYEHWYDGYVAYAVENGIIAKGEFKAADMDRAATRAEMAHIFAYALPSDCYEAISSVSDLPDVDGNTPYSADIFTLYAAGILTGSDEYGTFHPYSGITRAEAATILMRVNSSDFRAAAVF